MTASRVALLLAFPVLGLAAPLAGCGGSGSSTALASLVDRTAASGISFRHDNGHRGPFYFPETVPGGVALVDLDGDGDLEVYALQSGTVPGHLAAGSEADYHPQNQLFRNRGDGTFDDVTAASGDAAHAGYAMGVCAGDVDGDGLLDLFLTNTGPDALLVNRGDLSFEDTAAGTPLADPRWTTGCGFADVDQDGHLDLVVTSYVEWSVATEQECMAGGTPDYCHVSLYPGLSDRLYLGDGRGRFTDVTAETDLANRTGRGFGLALVDFDRDGDVDLYVANDSVENHYYVNEDGRFVDGTDLSGAAFDADGLAQAGMGVATGDLDDNGLPDLVVTNFAGESNTVYLNKGKGAFRDASRQTGITVESRPALGFGAAIGDLDRDGVMDLVVTNGHVMRNAGREGSPWRYQQPDQVFRGTRGGRNPRFEPIREGIEAVQVPRVGRGLALGDLDSDGGLDMVFLGCGEDLAVIGNELALPGSQWLRIRLVGRGSNTWAVGAFVRLMLDDGTTLRRWVQSGTGFLSQDDLRPTFGIPPGRTPEKVRITWPGGRTTQHPVTEVGRTIEVREPEPRDASSRSKPND